MSDAGTSETMDREGNCREVRFEADGRTIAIWLATECAVGADGDRERISCRVELGPLDLSFCMRPAIAREVGEALVALSRD